MKTPEFAFTPFVPKVAQKTKLPTVRLFVRKNGTYGKLNAAAIENFKPHGNYLSFEIDKQNRAVRFLPCQLGPLKVGEHESLTLGATLLEAGMEPGLYLLEKVKLPDQTVTIVAWRRSQ